MGRKFKIMLMLISLTVTLGMMSSTYSRYIANTTGNIDVLFAKWQILVNENDITNNASSTIAFTPVIEEDEHVQSNKVAPSSKGYFDIEIDPSNIEVSFSYSIELEYDNENIPDLLITKYAIIPSSYIEGDLIDTELLSGNVIGNTLEFDKTQGFRFEPFTVRVYFEWYEGTSEAMNDEADTEVGLEAVNDSTFQIIANISFGQVLE